MLPHILYLFEGLLGIHFASDTFLVAVSQLEPRLMAAVHLHEAKQAVEFDNVVLAVLHQVTQAFYIVQLGTAADVALCFVEHLRRVVVFASAIQPYAGGLPVGLRDIGFRSPL